MKKITIPVFLFLLAAASIQAQSLAPAGLSDWDDVIAAVDEANVNGGGVIHLKSRVEYRTTIYVDKPLPAIATNIVIEGNGAILKAADGYNGMMVEIRSEALLELNDLYITGFQRGLAEIPEEITGFIDNSGHLRLERVTFSNNPVCADCESSLPLMVNRAHCSMNNVTFFKNETKESATAIVNDAEMQIVNSTFSDSRHQYIFCGPWGLGIPYMCGPTEDLSSITANVNATTTFGNTLLNERCFIGGSVIDLGGNVVWINGCGLSTEYTVESKRNHLGSFNYHGGLVPTVGLEPGSGAIDAGNNDICSATDARFASRPVAAYPEAEPKCDAGAFEYGGAFGNADLAVNGMNGLWFSQTSDGHYVHVWRVSPDRVYINWTAFDQSADQMWIYAVADTVSESKFSATAYINEGGQIIPGGAPEGSVATEWGSIEVDLESCTVGTFRYESTYEGIGSGEFQIDRLAYVEGGGCSD